MVVVKVIKNITMFFLLPMCVIALFLSLNGVQQIGYGNDYYNFLQSVSKSFDSWKLEVPNIPQIPKLRYNSNGSQWEIISALFTIINIIISFFNGIVAVLNLLINIGNILVQVIQFVLTLIYQCKDFIGKMVEKWVSP